METDESVTRCLNCGKVLVYSGSGYGRLYCCDVCGNQYRRRRQRIEEKLKAEAEKEEKQLAEEDARTAAEKELADKLLDGSNAELACKYNRWIICNSLRAERTGRCQFCGFNPENEEERKRDARNRANRRRRRR